MKPILKISVMLLALILSTESAEAHRHHRHHVPHAVVAIAKPQAKVLIHNRLTRPERLQMAVAYLKGNEFLGARRYAKMTGLSRTTAEAELDAFAADAATPIAIVISGRKKLYTIGDID